MGEWRAAESRSIITGGERSREMGGRDFDVEIRCCRVPYSILSPRLVQRLFEASGFWLLLLACQTTENPLLHPISMDFLHFFSQISRLALWRLLKILLTLANDPGQCVCTQSTKLTCRQFLFQKHSLFSQKRSFFSQKRFFFLSKTFFFLSKNALFSLKTLLFLSETLSFLSETLPFLPKYKNNRAKQKKNKFKKLKKFLAYQVLF